MSTGNGNGGELRVNTFFGQFLYVNGAGETTFARYVRATGETEILDPSRAEECRRLIEAYIAEHPKWREPTPASQSADPKTSPASRGRGSARSAGSRPSGQLPLPPLPPTPPPALDLALRQPGEGALAVAAELARHDRLGNLPNGLRGKHTPLRAFRRGAAGERQVGQALGALPSVGGQGWYKLHSVPVGDRDSDIDHVVIGPGGVFTLDAKNRSKPVALEDGRLKVGDYATGEYLRNARHEAERAARLLSDRCGFGVTVRPVLVFVGRKLKRDGVAGDVIVVGLKDLVRVLAWQPPVLDEDQIKRIWAFARWPGTWKKGAPTAPV